MFRDREDAARQLAAKLTGRALQHPLVLAIPRGGVLIGAVLARELHADLDVVLSRKIRAPGQPELALGAVSETGEIYLDQPETRNTEWLKDYIEGEVHEQLAEIARRRALFRAVLPPVPMAGRSVIITDDGLATGSTMLAALKVARAQNPLETIVAVPVASSDRLAEVGRHCDATVCVSQPRHFHAIGQFYEDFTQIEDDEVVHVLREFANHPTPQTART